jgi:hypothetical protein
LCVGFSEKIENEVDNPASHRLLYHPACQNRPKAILFG